MLVISRKRNEAIIIGGIRVLVVEIKKDRVKIGIDDPTVDVWREEIYEPGMKRRLKPKPPGAKMDHHEQPA